MRIINGRLRSTIGIMTISFIVIISPSIILSINEYIDPFSFHTVGLALLYHREGRYNPYPISEKLGWQSTANEISIRFVPTLFVLILSEVSGISLWYLLFLPIIGFILPLFAYLIFKKLQDSSMAVMYAISIGFSLFTFNVNFFYISAGLLFFFAFVLILLNSLNPKRSVKRTELIQMIIFFVASYFTYYTAEFLILSLLLSYVIFAWILERMKFYTSNTKFHSLIIIFLMIFTVFDRVFYWYMKSMTVDKGLDLFKSYLDYVIHFLRKGEAALVEYRPHIGNPFVAYVDLAQNLIIWLIIVVYVMYRITKMRRCRKDLIEHGFRDIVLVALLMSGLLEMLIYLMIGYGVYTRTIMLASSLMSLYVLSQFYTMYRLRHGELVKIFLIIITLSLVLLSIARLVIRVNDPVNPNGANLHTKMKSAISWIMTYTDRGVVITDLRTVSQVFYDLIRERKEEHIILKRLGTEVHYLYNFTDEVADLVFGEKNSLLLLSHEFKRRAFIAGEAWKISPPMKDSLLFLDHCTSVNRIYDDGNGLIYHYVGRT